MIGQYRKKPVVIEAEQFHPDQKPWPPGVEVERRFAGTTGFRINTLEGWYAVTPDDWIITGIKGEKYPCKPDIFEATYDPVDANQTPLADAKDPAVEADPTPYEQFVMDTLGEGWASLIQGDVIVRDWAAHEVAREKEHLRRLHSMFAPGTIVITMVRPARPRKWWNPRTWWPREWTVEWTWEAAK